MESGSEMLQSTLKHHFGSNGPRNNADGYRNTLVFSSFCMHSGSEIIQNTPKHHFWSSGGHWVYSCESVHRNFGTVKQCISVPKRTSFSSFCMHLASEMLQNTPKHHFGSNRGY